MTIQQLYEKYEIMPNLQLHMYRVAAVAKMICDHFKKSINKQEVVITCLLHDIGNIIKFDLFDFPQFLEPLGFEYWYKVQIHYIKKYGNDEHVASQKIAEELGIDDRIRELMDSVSFIGATENYQTNDFAKKICSYADVRVTPFGVVSLEKRLADLEQRYGNKYPGEAMKKKRAEFQNYLRKMESQIFQNCSLKPEQITETAIAPIIQELKNVEAV